MLLYNHYNSGDKAYIIESNRTVREVRIVKIAAGFATVRFPNTDGGIRVRESRLFPTREDGEACLPKEKSKKNQNAQWN